MKTALVCGAGGFIGSWLVKRLKTEGYYVTGVDLKYPEYSQSPADEFFIQDLRDFRETLPIFEGYARSVACGKNVFDEVYQLAADMGGAGFVFTGEHDADILTNSALINLNIVQLCQTFKAGKVFYSSSACMYPERNQMDPNNPNCAEDSAYPAAPDSEYGWEKLFSERIYLAYARNYKMNVRIARFHNIFGPEGTWDGGREKAPAAICRKIAQVSDYGTIDIWGDGKQTRSFLLIHECINGVRRLMDSDFTGPVNIGSSEMVTINQLFDMIKVIAEKPYITRHHIPGPLGVAGRNSDNRLIYEKLNWRPCESLFSGLTTTYAWIKKQVEAKNRIS